MRRHSVLVTASLASALAAAAAILIIRAHAGGGIDAGPLACRGCSTISVSLPVKIGELVVAGDMDIVNPGPHPLVLDHVRPLHGSPGLTLDAVRVVTVDHPDALRSLNHTPPHYPLGSVPSRGYLLVPGDAPDIRIELLIGIRAVHSIQSFRGIAIDYHVGARRYRAEYPYFVRLCAFPRHPLEHSCPSLPTR